MKDVKDLQKKLTFEIEHIANKKPDIMEKSQEFCEEYKYFLSVCKTEREAVSTIIEMAKANGYTEYCSEKNYKAGDKVYLNNRNRALILSTIGTLTVDNGIRIAASHIDSPRLDLKPNPLYEKNEISYFKTHY